MAECPDITTDLDCDEALAVIEPFFVAQQDDFLEAGLKRTKRTRLYCAPWVHDSPRHFAACRDDGLAIVVAPELAELSTDLVVGILAHEFGHATDYLYPGDFVLGREERAQRRVREEFNDDQWSRWIKTWQERDDDLVEQMADAIVEWATGTKIGYRGPCMLQCFERGAARPQGLR
jgi:hypothetical protein